MKIGNWVLNMLLLFLKHFIYAEETLMFWTQQEQKLEAHWKGILGRRL